MFAYLYGFVTFVCAVLWQAHLKPGDHRYVEACAIVADILTTDASAYEALVLLNISAYESGYERDAHNPQGSHGAFQVMDPAPSYGAREALRRLRTQGIFGYMGCRVVTPECESMAAKRQVLAIIYAATFPPSREDATDRDLEARR